MKYTLVLVLLLFAGQAFAGVIDLDMATSGTASIHTCLSDLCPAPGEGSVSVSGPGFSVGGAFFPLNPSPHGEPIPVTFFPSFLFFVFAGGGVGLVGDPSSHFITGGGIDLITDTGFAITVMVDSTGTVFPSDTYAFTTGPWEGSIVQTVVLSIPGCVVGRDGNCFGTAVWNGELHMVQSPEPATWLLLAGGLGMLVWYGVVRRRYERGT